MKITSKIKRAYARNKGFWLAYSVVILTIWFGRPAVDALFSLSPFVGAPVQILWTGAVMVSVWLGLEHFSAKKDLEARRSQVRETQTLYSSKGRQSDPEFIS